MSQCFAHFFSKSDLNQVEKCSFNILKTFWVADWHCLVKNGETNRLKLLRLRLLLVCLVTLNKNYCPVRTLNFLSFFS